MPHDGLHQEPNYLAACAALGLDAYDVDPIEVPAAIARLVEAHDAHERLASLLIELLHLRDLEIRVLRKAGSVMHGDAGAMRATLTEGMELVGVSPGEEGSVSRLIAKVTDLEERAQ